MKSLHPFITFCIGLCFFLCGIQGDLQAQTPSYILVKNGCNYQYGTQNMDKAAYRLFLQNECPKAYQQYKQGRECAIAGWTLLGAGLVGVPLSAAGVFVSGFGMSAAPTPSDNAVAVQNLCLTSLALSGAMVIASVPLLSVGYHLMDKSVDTFNEQCHRPAVELSFQTTGSSIGIALNF